MLADIVSFWLAFTVVIAIASALMVAFAGIYCHFLANAAAHDEPALVSVSQPRESVPRYRLVPLEDLEIGKRMPPVR